MLCKDNRKEDEMYPQPFANVRTFKDIKVYYLQNDSKRFASND